MIGEKDMEKTWLQPQDLASLQRYNEICEDFDADGHDVQKEAMARLYELGGVRSIGFGRSEMTSFGAYVIAESREEICKLPLFTKSEIEANWSARHRSTLG